MRAVAPEEWRPVVEMSAKSQLSCEVTTKLRILEQKYEPKPWQGKVWLHLFYLEDKKRLQLM